MRTTRHPRVVVLGLWGLALSAGCPTCLQLADCSTNADCGGDGYVCSADGICQTAGNTTGSSGIVGSSGTSQGSSQASSQGISNGQGSSLAGNSSGSSSSRFSSSLRASSSTAASTGGNSGNSGGGASSSGTAASSSTGTTSGSSTAGGSGSSASGLSTSLPLSSSSTPGSTSAGVSSSATVSSSVGVVASSSAGAASSGVLSSSSSSGGPCDPPNPPPECPRPWLATIQPAGNFRAMWAAHTTPLFGGAVVVGERGGHDVIFLLRDAVMGGPLWSTVTDSAHDVGGPIPSVPAQPTRYPLLALTYSDNQELRYLRETNGTIAVDSNAAFGAHDHFAAVIQGPPTGPFTTTASNFSDQNVASHVVWGTRASEVDVVLTGANDAIHLAATCAVNKQEFLVADGNGNVYGLRSFPLPGDPALVQFQSTGNLAVAGTAIYPPVVLDHSDSEADVFVFRNSGADLTVTGFKVDSNGALSGLKPPTVVANHTMSGPAALAVEGVNARLLVPTSQGVVLSFPANLEAPISIPLSTVPLKGVLAVRTRTADQQLTLVATDTNGSVYAVRGGTSLPGFPLDLGGMHTITQAPLVASYPGSNAWHLVVVSETSSTAGFVTGWTFGEASDTSNTWSEYQQHFRNRGCVVGP